MTASWNNTLAPTLAAIAPFPTIAFVQHFLATCQRPGVPAPHAAPMDNGSILLTWQNPELETEINIEISPSGCAHGRMSRAAFDYDVFGLWFSQLNQQQHAKRQENNRKRWDNPVVCYDGWQIERHFISTGSATILVVLDDEDEVSITRGKWGL